MLLHNNPLFCIYFGSADDELDPDRYLHFPPGIRLLSLDPFKKLKKTMQLKRLTFLHQVHSDEGVIVTEQEQEPFKRDGDFLITQQRNVGIGIMSADCLPIVFFDTVKHIVAIAHVGWRGTINQIAVKTVADMQERFGTKSEHLRIFFGPSARKCCYKIDRSFMEQLEGFSYSDKILVHDDDAIRLDLPLFNRIQLQDIGVPKEAFKTQYNVCTICDERYCSYRRDGRKAQRQMTVVALK